MREVVIDVPGEHGGNGLHIVQTRGKGETEGLSPHSRGSFHRRKFRQGEDQENDNPKTKTAEHQGEDRIVKSKSL